MINTRIEPSYFTAVSQRLINKGYHSLRIDLLPLVLMKHAKLVQFSTKQTKPGQDVHQNYTHNMMQPLYCSTMLSTDIDIL